MRRFAIAVLVVSAGLVFAATYPWGDMVGHSHWTRVRWIPFKTGPFRLLDIAGNLLLCAPLGAAAGYLFSRGVLAAALLSLAISVGAEASQVYSHTRFPSATDVLCNVAGAVAAAEVVRRRYLRRQRFDPSSTKREDLHRLQQRLAEKK